MSAEQYEDFVTRAVALPEEQRAALVDALLETLPDDEPDGVITPEIRAEFERMKPEYERRFREWKRLRNGIPGDEVMAELKAIVDDARS